MDRKVIMISRREREILAFISNGYTDSQISTQLGLKEATIAAHIQKMLRKNRFDHRYQLVHWAYSEGVLI